MTQSYPIPPLFVYCDEMFVGSDRIFWAATRSYLSTSPVDLRQQPFDLLSVGPELAGRPAHQYTDYKSL
jgi:hypothetical protein